MALPSGGPNVQQPIPQPAVTSAPAFNGGLGVGQAMPFSQQMMLPSGGPNVQRPVPAPDPTANAAAGPPGWSGWQYQPGTALTGGGPNAQQPTPRPQPSFDLSGLMDIFNRPMPVMPQMPMPAPNPISYGSFQPQQFSFMGGRTAPPMPFNGMMKGMFGIR